MRHDQAGLTKDDRKQNKMGRKTIGADKLAKVLIEMQEQIYQVPQNIHVLSLCNDQAIERHWWPC
jgi:hypothetical protein